MGVAGFICLFCFVSIYLFAHNNTQPLDGEGAERAMTRWDGRGGGVCFHGGNFLK